VAEDRNALLLSVAQRYWEQGCTQEEIGAELHLTRWKVGRLLEEARNVGIVQIRVVHPQARRTDLEVALRARFGLQDAVVVPTAAEAVGTAGHVARAAAGYLRSLGPGLRTLGVSWGNTLQAVAAVLPSGWTSGLEVVQTNGSVSRTVRPTTAANVAMSIAQSGQGRATLLPLPAIVEHASTRDALYSETFVQETLARARAADALLFSLGALDRQSVLVESGAITLDELDRLRAAGACGDVLGHYVTASGSVADPDIEGRTIGLSLDDLRHASRSVAVASGSGKADIIGAALVSRLCSVLVTDEAAARTALDA
jgi:deoxyribonucleoside regulator